MKVSVVMTVLDGERFLSEAIESVLNQSLEDFEFLIVDDASTDETAAILASYARRDSRIRVLTNDVVQGPFLSANRALRQAAGDAIARHDADDVSPSDRFAVQWAALKSSSRVTLVTGWVERFGVLDSENELVKPPPEQSALEWNLLFSNAVGAGAHVMFPRVLDDIAVEYPARQRYAEDYELLCRLAALGTVISPETIVYRYRQHQHSITCQRRVEQDECVSLIRHHRQSMYLGTGVPRSVIDALARFWLRDGARPLGSNVHRVMSTLGQLRTAFLVDIARRHGEPARAILRRSIHWSTQERIGYWLYRSIRFRDRAAVQAMFHAASEGDPVRACWSALRHGGLAVRHRLS